MFKVEIASCRIAGRQTGATGGRPAAVRLPVLGLALLGAWAGVAGAALPPQAAAGAPARAFNFAYLSQGARAAAPTQIFDDGQRTYMQFNALDRVPELWTDDGNGARGGRRIGFHLESPYVVIDQVLPRMRLVIDGEDTVLVNQAWRASKPAAPKPPAVRQAAPRIWTDNTPFGPEDPPGPVASSRAARPSHDAAHDPPANAAAAPAGRSALAVSEEDDNDGDAMFAHAGEAPPRDVDEATRRLVGQPLLTSQMLGDSELEAMRVQAIEMIARARQAGDSVLEQRLRRIFQEVALVGLEPPERSSSAKRRRDGRWQHGPLLALADTRPRSDTPVHEDGESAAARASQPGGGADPSGGVTARAAAATPAGIQGQVGAVGSSAPAAAAEPVTPRSENLVFEVRDNQRLSQALGQFLETLGWRLEWESQSDFVVRRGYVVKAPTLKQVLLQTLGEYRLSAVLYSGNLVVAVTGGDR